MDHPHPSVLHLSQPQDVSGLLLKELESVKALLAQSHLNESKAIAEKEAAALLAQSLREENAALLASCASAREAAVQAALKEYIEREWEETVSRRAWLRSPEAVLAVLAITAQNGFSAKGFKNLARAFRYDEQLWDAIKDRRGKYGWTHLMVAARDGDVERVQWLLKRSANVNAVAKEGETPLLLACKGGHLEIARMLLAKEADASASMNDNKMTVLMYAASHGLLEIVKQCIDRGVQLDALTKAYYLGDTALTFAAKNGHLEAVRLLLDNGADSNAAFYKMQSRSYLTLSTFTTPLIGAAENGNLEIARLLLERGANVNAIRRYGNGKTALFAAIRKNHLEMVSLLISLGADLTQTDDFWETALVSACSKGYLEVARLLLDRGVNVDEANPHERWEYRKGTTALIRACEMGYLDTALLLIDRGANVNSALSSGDTPLILASKGGHLSVVLLLLEKGANKSALNNDGKSALMVARSEEVQAALQ